MPRTLNLVLSLVLAGAVAACSAPSGGPGTSGSASPSAPPGPSGPPAPSSPPAPPPPADPWLLTADGVGPYRLGQRIDSMPAGIFGESTPVDAANCPELYTTAATGIYAGTLLFVVRHNVLVDISTGGGDPGVHTAQDDRVGTPWSTVETRHGPTTPAPGTWKTGPGGARAFVIADRDRVILFAINPIRPDGVGGISAGLADHTQHVFLTGAAC